MISTIVLPTFLLSAFLSICWGLYLIQIIRDHSQAREAPFPVRRIAIIVSFRRIVVTFCLWMICFSYVFRTIFVLVGLDELTIGRIIFFALLGTNIPGAIFTVVSLRYD